MSSPDRAGEKIVVLKIKENEEKEINRMSILWPRRVRYTPLYIDGKCPKSSTEMFMWLKIAKNANAFFFCYSTLRPFSFPRKFFTAEEVASVVYRSFSSLQIWYRKVSFVYGKKKEEENPRPSKCWLCTESWTEFKILDVAQMVVLLLLNKGESGLTAP